MTDAKPMPSERMLGAYNSGYGETKELRKILDELWAAVFPDREEAREGGDTKCPFDPLGVAGELLLVSLAAHPSPSEAVESDCWTKAERDQFFEDRGRQVEELFMERAELQVRIDKALDMLHGEGPERDKWSAWGRGFLDSLITTLDGTAVETPEAAK
jgi:hypothetical protein